MDEGAARQHLALAPRLDFLHGDDVRQEKVRIDEDAEREAGRDAQHAAGQKARNHRGSAHAASHRPVICFIRHGECGCARTR